MALIIDTDIGSDVDDALALFYAIKSGLDIKLITTVHGNTELRAKLAKRLTSLLGKDIPVAVGEEKPLKQRQIFATGLEDDGFVSPAEVYDIRKNGVDELASIIYTNKGIDIAAIGPLTNLAKAFTKYPDLPSYIGTLFMMGNAQLAPDRFYLNYRAHNFKVDPEAVDLVMAADVEKVIVTTDVCKKNYLTKDDLQQFQGTAALDYLKQSAFKWLDFIGYEHAFLYDPLVVHHHLDSSLTTKAKYSQVSISTEVQPGFSARFIAAVLGEPLK